MKKYLALLLLLVLVVWGLYHTAGNKQAANGGTPSPGGVTATVGLRVGNLAPDFELKTLDGQAVKLSSLRGKKVILNFWATWCPPCKSEIPEIEKFYTQNKGQGIDVLAVDLYKAERDPDGVPAFLKSYGITYPVVLDAKGLVGDLYQAYSIPTTYILDSNGVIRQKVVGPMTVKSMTQMLKAIK